VILKSKNNENLIMDRRQFLLKHIVFNWYAQTNRFSKKLEFTVEHILLENYIFFVECNRYCGGL